MPTPQEISDALKPGLWGQLNNDANYNDLFKSAQYGLKSPAPVDPGMQAPSFTQKLGQTWPAQAAKSVYGAATLPGDVYAGRVDPGSDEAIGRSFDLASALAGASPATAVEGALGAFGGRRPGKADFMAMLETQRSNELPVVKSSVETIVSPAVKFGGKVYEGMSHFSAREKAPKDLWQPLYQPPWNSEKLAEARAAHGFTTSKGRFVSRQEAEDIFRKQTGEITGPLINEGMGLTAEDFRHTLGIPEEAAFLSAFGHSRKFK